MPGGSLFACAQILLAFFFVDADDFPALIMTAVRANCVRRAKLAAVVALDQINRHQSVL